MTACIATVFCSCGMALRSRDLTFGAELCFLGNYIHSVYSLLKCTAEVGHTIGAFVHARVHACLCLETPAVHENKKLHGHWTVGYLQTELIIF